MNRMSLFEAARRDPRLLLLRCDDGLQTSLERSRVPGESCFHVRVRGRVVYSGAYEAAKARYERAWEAQYLRRSTGQGHATPRQRLCPPATVRLLPCARRPDGGYVGRRRLSWRSLVPPPAAAPRLVPLARLLDWDPPFNDDTAADRPGDAR